MPDRQLRWYGKKGGRLSHAHWPVLDCVSSGRLCPRFGGRSTFGDTRTARGSDDAGSVAGTHLPPPLSGSSLSLHLTCQAPTRSPPLLLPCVVYVNGVFNAESTV